MKYLPMLLLASCPACTVGYQGLLDEADVPNPNVALSPDAQTGPDAAELPDSDACVPSFTTCTGCFAQEYNGCSVIDCTIDNGCSVIYNMVDAGSDRDTGGTCVPITSCRLAVAPDCITQEDDGCGGQINCELSKDCYMNVPDGATACVVSSCPTCAGPFEPCCSTTTYGACGCNVLGT